MSLLTPGHRELNVSHLTRRVGDAEHRITGLLELTLPGLVLALRPRPPMTRPVDLDPEPLARPVEGDFDVEQRRVHARRCRPLRQTREERVLEAALRAGTAAAVQR